MRVYTNTTVSSLTALFILLYQSVGFGQKFPEMVFVEGGTFQMGDQSGMGDSDEYPLHKVTVGSFHLAKTVTTVQQWKAFCDSTRRKMPDAPKWGWKDDYPIVNVDWYEVMDYLQWLSRITGQTYRLPTEAEWEFAGKGGTKSKNFKYSGGHFMDAVGWYSVNGQGAPKPVGQKRSNELGLFDMSGNIMEWCNDWYGPYGERAEIDPKGPAEGDGKVMRGGNYANASSACRPTWRRSLTPTIRVTWAGFRVARSE